MRSFLVALAVVAVALVALGLTRSSSLVYSDGVKPAIAAATVKPGDETCQAPLQPPDGSSFDRVGVLVGTFFKPGPALEVTVREAGSRRELGSGRLPGGYPDLARSGEHVTEVGRVEAGEPLSVCVANRGDQNAAIYGQVGIASPFTSATMNGTAIPNDLTVHLRDDDRSLLALLPEMAERASLFRAGWVTPGVYLVLALLVLVGVPLLLARALRAAER